MAKMTDKELEAFLAEGEEAPKQMTDAEIEAALSEPEQPQEMSLGEGLGRTVTKSLPMVGSLIGAAIGTGASTPLAPFTAGLSIPAGMLEGSALGAAAGVGAENLINQYVYDEKPKENTEVLKDMGKEMVYDVAGNLIGEKIISPVIGLAAKGVGKVYNKFAGGISKIPETVMETMQSRYSNVNDITDVAHQADVIRDQMQKDIRSYKTAQNAGISEAIKDSGQKTVSLKSVKDTLQSVLKRLDPNINPEKFARVKKELDIIDQVIDRPQEDAAAVSQYLKDLDLYEKEAARAAQTNEPVQMALPELPTRPTGQFNAPRGDDLLPTNQKMALEERSKRMSMGRANKGQQIEMNTTPEAPVPPKFDYSGAEVTADQAYQLSQRLQNLADYTADGQALKKKDLIDVVFARAAGKARNEVQKAIPEIAQYNKNLSNLHLAGKNINKNLLVSDKPYSSLIGVGTGENKLAVKQMSRFQEAIGKDYIPQMQDLAAAQYFGNAGLLPGEKTGSSLAPLIISGGLGLQDLASGQFGQGAAKMAFGLPMTPIGIKTTIGVKEAAKNVLGKVGVTPARIGSESIQAISPYLVNKAQEYIKSPERTPQGQADIAAVLQTMSPYDREQYIKNDNSITPTQRAILLKQSRSAR